MTATRGTGQGRAGAARRIAACLLAAGTLLGAGSVAAAHGDASSVLPAASEPGPPDGWHLSPPSFTLRPLPDLAQSPPLWHSPWQPAHRNPPAAHRRPAHRRTALREAPATVVRLVNRERAHAHCGPVRVDATLARAAQRHSKAMARAHSLSHNRPEHTAPGRRVAAAGYRWHRVGENVARGQDRAGDVVRVWMASTEHRATVLTCAYRDAGVGVSTGSGGPWWTLLLASHR
ncbi:CAP domain-containing protein [Streptomyces sp. NPDC059740]|uniref:CAP domain-containing protein n=1 Tax=Streptomyces sp. NPDC059740 TaxID=3346926 RepID=UPI0036563D81